MSIFSCLAHVNGHVISEVTRIPELRARKIDQMPLGKEHSHYAEAPANDRVIE